MTRPAPCVIKAQIMSQSFNHRVQKPFPRGHDIAALALFRETCPVEIACNREFLEGVISGSPYLKQLIQNHSEFAKRCFNDVPEHLLEELLLLTQQVEGDLLHNLRIRKAEFALLCGLCDLGNLWSLEEVTRAITRFADAAIQTAVKALLLEAHVSGKYILPDPQNPNIGCGYVILAMGKHGAFELNYSSDVDLIVLYDAETTCLPVDAEVAKFFVKLTQKFVSVLQETTIDGYVFRTDLRLRPDPRATQIAISVESAATYYENQGQNWERAAYIKARAIAGDIALGEDFLNRLKPYIWRKYLDFAAIADVQSLIRQIHAVKGHGDIAVEGHNLKLGRGGIREIEFFVQTQQLIAGGRNVQLRGRRTCDMLHALANAKWIEPETAVELQADYTLLRTWEHRAQMQRDEQTHVLPTGKAFEDFSQFCGFENAEAFHGVVRKTLENVRSHSAKLFEQTEGLGSAGALVFTGGEDDPETIANLQRMGFEHASEISATIRGWHFGRYAATRDKRAKEALTELMPKLLEALSRSGDADRTFLDFDAFLKGLPAGVQLFAMLKSNPGLLDLLAQILGTAPRLSHGLSRQPRILEAVLDPSFFGPLPTREDLMQSVQQLLPQDVPLDEAMDRLRVFVREQKFRVGVRVLSETVTAEEAGSGFTNIADCALAALLNSVEHDIQKQHGQIRHGRFAVLAMGKLGGREMTAGSDLDLIVVFDHAEETTQSDGERPLAPTSYFTKLTQRLITAISAPTAEGQLYDVDMRLRPSGSKGPVAVSLNSFKTYQAESAWTWEKLALTRARPIAGDVSLCLELETVKRTVLAAARDEDSTRDDVTTMRGLMLREHKMQSPWDIKRVRGGLVEVEFIVQFLQLINAHSHPSILSTNTLVCLEKLQAVGVISAGDAHELVSATRLYQRLTQLLRLCLDTDYRPDVAPRGLNRAVAIATGLPDVKSTEAALQQTQASVAAFFDALVGIPK
jgi:[glutamine synthetase] adenylyltransferase / [glutamine synthetase]-adenylyl-L-tyrosine phosphorylase